MCSNWWETCSNLNLYLYTEYCNIFTISSCNCVHLGVSTNMNESCNVAWLSVMYYFFLQFFLLFLINVLSEEFHNLWKFLLDSFGCAGINQSKITTIFNTLPYYFYPYRQLDHWCEQIMTSRPLNADISVGVNWSFQPKPVNCCILF
jgi:hypothetical protein